jgi:hypothetical protein
MVCTPEDYNANINVTQEYYKIRAGTGLAIYNGAGQVADT